MINLQVLHIERKTIWKEIFCFSVIRDFMKYARR